MRRPSWPATVRIDPSKERLVQALLVITGRNDDTQRLAGMLTDSKEQMEAMHKTGSLKNLEDQRLMSRALLQGETYGSMRQQVHAMRQQVHTMRAERVELTKQLEAARG